MKKLFFIAFALMLSFTSAFAGDDHQTRELNRNEEPDAGGGGGGTAGEIYVIVFKGWCGKAHVEGIFDHDPSSWETARYIIAANLSCAMMINPYDVFPHPY
ncbi:hypothetical protein [Prevotella sp. khp7]|uniref:hypothetical protein n=1 Tax=Prevotella sp. khp7 TaxID=1761885 RepID=UPI00115FCCCA|nr:hypothetical protein [Prevotella sp. khp7]